MNDDSKFDLARTVALVAVTLAVQALTAMALAVPSVLAPVAAADFDRPATAVGQWVGFSYSVAMFAGLASGTFVGRYGPVRVLQVAVVAVALGLLIGAGAHLSLLLVCGAFLGAAHGFVNPATSALLVATAPPRMRSMIFSIKQTGVPVGGALAGMLVPLLLLWTHWRVAMLILSIATATFLVLLVPFRRKYDANRGMSPGLRFRSLAAPVAEVWSNPRMRELAIVSGVFSAVQMSFTTYLVSYLKLELAYSLVASGLVLSSAQVAGVVGRILWGAAADRTARPRRVLAVLGVIMGLCGAVATSFTSEWPTIAVLGVCILYGGTAVGWNGVFLAEVARLAPEGRVAIVTGGTQFFTFAGVLIGPPTFGVIASAAGSYGAGFALIAALPFAAGVALFASRPAAGTAR